MSVSNLPANLFRRLPAGIVGIKEAIRMLVDKVGPVTQTIQTDLAKEPNRVHINIVELLKLRGLDTNKEIKLVRHQDQRHDLYELIPCELIPTSTHFIISNLF